MSGDTKKPLIVKPSSKNPKSPEHASKSAAGSSYTLGSSRTVIDNATASQKLWLRGRYVSS